MPIPLPGPIPTPAIPSPVAPARPVTGTPYYTREHQGWAVEQERYRHNGPLYTLGEWVIFVLLWKEIDHRRGLVERCARCFRSGHDISDRVSAVYKQPTQQKCPDCLGTTFEGGFRARIVRPAILSEVDESERLQKRGETHPANHTVNTTVDFRARNGDFLIRADNSRWQLDVPRRTTLRSGLEHPAQGETGLNYSGMTAKYEEEGQIVYQVPPTDPADVAAVLHQPMSQSAPADFSGFEIKRAELIPPALLD
jgi:hypothetical protein